MLPEAVLPVVMTEAGVVYEEPSEHIAGHRELYRQSVGARLEHNFQQGTEIGRTHIHRTAIPHARPPLSVTLLPLQTY